MFPITPKKMLNYSFLQLFISNGADQLVSKIISNNTVDLSNLGINDDIQGSNTFAFNNNKTKNGETYLAINTHQPLDGPNSWYEVHLNSEEGTNILGATFAGAPCILTGVNEHLAWTHTVNYPDKADLFKLKMHNSKKNIYLVDGQEFKLEIISPEKTLMQTDAKQVTIPAFEGEMTLLKDHISLITFLIVINLN